jgi:hypothetical protein
MSSTGKSRPTSKLNGDEVYRLSQRDNGISIRGGLEMAGTRSAAKIFVDVCCVVALNTEQGNFQRLTGCGCWCGGCCCCCCCRFQV